MGDRAQDAPTACDIETMQNAVKAGLRAGALGCRSGVPPDIEVPQENTVPGTYSEEDELAALMAVMAEAGSGVLQVVPAGVGGEMGGDQRHSIDAEIDWITRLGLQHRVPMTFLAMVNEQDPTIGSVVRLSSQAKSSGANIRPQVASRAFGMLMGHQSKMNPFRHRATYQALMDLPFEERIARLRDPA